MGQLTEKDAGTRVEMQKTLFLWELQEYKSPGIMLSLDINGSGGKDK